MNWEKLTAPEFEKAVKACGGVCLLPLGVVEKHGDHLPLGQDYLYIHRVSSMAAEKETAMVFPPFYFGQIIEARHVPGTIALSRELLQPLLEAVCDEIRRNGFNKIIMVNGHGGNAGLLDFFALSTLERDVDYVVYISRRILKGKAARAQEAAVDGHGGETETSSMLHLHPELVRMKAFGSYGLPLKRIRKFRDAGLHTGIWWYADYPGHFCADRTVPTPEKGRVFVREHVSQLVRQIRLVKQDDTPLRLLKEYHARADKPKNRYP